ncbi:MAG TPA: XRE family transcriptional regulator [Candidatus Cloacimonas sp.]|nr:XRE family transcriptional regulator [Candidatus Cloacimonas sp.]
MDTFNKRVGKRIKELREKHNLTQENLANKLGVNRSLITNLENGNRKITAEEMQKIAQLFNISVDALLNPETEISVMLGNQEKPEESKSPIRISVPQKNVKKFKEVLLYLLNRIGSKPNVGETVLYKILYFIDFDFYEKYEEQIIGATYQKNNYGPTPKEFAKIVSEMEGKDLRKIKDKYFQYPRTKYLPLREPDLSILTARELEIIEQVIARLGNMNASQISEYSHGDVPWLTTDDKKIIDYEKVFYRTTPYSVRNDAE